MSGLIPQSFIEEIIHKTELVELIDSYVPLKKRGNSYLACCPFHQEKTPSFNVIPRKQFFHCFGCGQSGNAISFVMAYLNQNFTQAIDTLADRLGLTVPHNEQSKSYKTNDSLYDLLAKVSQYYQNQLKTQGAEAIRYLQNRGISGEIARCYQIGYAASDWHQLEKKFIKEQKQLITTGMLISNDQGRVYDRYRGRIMFPIYDRYSRIIAFGGRSIHPEQQPKYLNSPETILFQKGRELYGLHQVLQQDKQPKHFIVVEGYLDVIALAQFGLPYAVATLGTATSTYHVQLLSKYSKTLIFCFDGDKAGRQAAWRALESSLPHLENGLDVRFVFLPEGQDPDSFIRTKGKEEFELHLHAAVSLNQFLIEQLSNSLNLQDLAGRSQLVTHAKPLLQKIPAGAYKQLLIDELCRLTRLEPHRMIEFLEDKDKNVMPSKIEKPQKISRSPLRLAIALLLQNPEIFDSIKDKIDINILDQHDHQILIELIDALQANPSLNTAQLIELWRESDYFNSLNKLAFWEHQVPQEALAKEFIDILGFLQKQNIDFVVNQLLKKSRSEGLSQPEKVQLQNLLKQKHLSLHDKN